MFQKAGKIIGLIYKLANLLIVSNMQKCVLCFVFLGAEDLLKDLAETLVRFFRFLDISQTCGLKVFVLI